MNKKVTAMVLSGALVCTMGLQALAADKSTQVQPILATEQGQTLPNSVLYYGQVKELIKDADGTISGLYMASEQDGEYVFHISEQTVWVDSGNHTASDPADLKVGEGIYVFHSPVSTRSLPPQSAAFAIVRNLPQDVGSAQLHVVEAVEKQDGVLKITTDNGGLIISVDDKTGMTPYRTRNIVTMDDIKAGDQIMAWYGAVALSYPGQTYADFVMLLPQESGARTGGLTRASLVSLLHDKKGNPVVNYAMSFSDVTGSETYGEAVRWAASQKLVSGYDNGNFGPNDTMTKEQLVTILWRYSGSPILADYTGLSQYSDVGKISGYAMQAMQWAHQKGLITADGDGLLAPQIKTTVSQAQEMLAKLPA